MNKTIEEMTKIIMGAIPDTIQFEQAPANEVEARMEAEALYNAGYRKTFTSEFASPEQKAYKEGYILGLDLSADSINDIRKGTAKEIVEILHGYNYDGEIDELITAIGKRYGV